MDDELDLSVVDPADVVKVLNRAADLVAQHGWTPKRTKGGRLSVLHAITKACDEIAGPGVDSAELHVACLDAVCLTVFGDRHGQGASVSRWERQIADVACDNAIEAEVDNVVAMLRKVAA